MESPIKCFNIEAFGNHHRVFADQSVDAEYVQETLNLGKVSVFQFSYTEYLIADNWLIYMESYLQKKGLFRFELKKIFKETQKSLRKRLRLWKKIQSLVIATSTPTSSTYYDTDTREAARPNSGEIAKP